VFDELGTAAKDGDDRSVRYVRTLDAAPEEVWAALTDPERLARWMLTDSMVMEPRVGGEVHYAWSHDHSDGIVAVWDPPHTLEYTWNEDNGASVVRFELAARHGGTELTLFHRFISPRFASEIGAGWHTHLDLLDATLRGGTFEFGPRYDTLKPLYEEQFDSL
jgi:uncharacterized protein YndB with AHSA1/START domain